MADFRSRGGGRGHRASWGFRRERFAAQGISNLTGKVEPHRRATGRRFDPSVRPGVRVFPPQSSNNSQRPIPESKDKREGPIRIQPYAEALSSGTKHASIFRDIPIKSRPVLSRNGAPFVCFSEDEVRLAAKDMANAIVLKFSASRPKVQEVQEVMLKSWNLSSTPTMTALDGRHILVICESESDAVEVLTQDSNLIGQARFRTFRWQPGFSANAEPVVMVSWATVRGLDPSLCRPSFLREICRGFGKFLKVDQRTVNLSQPGTARVCVEVNVRRPLVQGMWVGTEHWQQWVHIEYEGKVSYCLRCKKQGHSVDHCRREIARNQQAKSRASQGRNQFQRKDKASSSYYSILEEPAALAMEEKGHGECSQQEVPWSLVQRKHSKALRNRRSVRDPHLHPSSQASRETKSFPGVTEESPAVESSNHQHKQPAKDPKYMAKPEEAKLTLPAPPSFAISNGSGDSQVTSPSIPQAIPSSLASIPAPRGEQISRVLEAHASKAGGQGAAPPEKPFSSSAEILPYVQNTSETATIQTNESSESGTFQTAIESAFMRRIRSCMEDFMFQMQGYSSTTEIHPTTYKRMLSIDDSVLSASNALALHWEEYQDLPLSVAPSNEEDLEEVNKDISDHIISLQKARDSSRRVTRSATKFAPKIINDD